MKLSTIIILIVSIALIVIGGSISIVAISSVGFDYYKLVGQNGLSKNTYEFNSEDVTSVLIQDVNADVRVLVGDYYPVKAIVLSDSPYSVDVVSGRLTIKKHLNFSLYHTLGKPKVELYLPNKTYQQLDISTISGDVEVFDVAVSNSLNIDTTSGSIAAHFTTAGDFDAKTVSGDIIFDTASANNFVANAGSGDISLKNMDVKASSDVSTVSGDVSVNSLSSQEMQIVSGSGDVCFDDLEVLKSLKVETISGSVNGQLSDRLTKTGYRFDISTTSGNINVPTDEGMKPVTVSTVSGDVTLTIMRG